MENKDFHRNDLSFHSPIAAIFSKAYFKYACMILFIELIAAAACAALPLAQKLLIDGVNALNRTLTVEGALAVAVLTGVTLLCQTGSYLLRFRLGVEARCRLKTSVFHCLLGIPENFLKERGSGYFFNRIQTDSTEIVSFYSGDALLQFSFWLKFLVSYAVIVFLHWECACLALPFLLLQYVFYRKYRQKQYRLGHKIQECVAVERYRMQEYLSGHTTLKTHNAVRQTTERLDKGFAHWRVLSFQRLFLENRFRLFSYAPVYLCCGGVTVYGLYQILERQWTLGGLWALLMLLRQIFTPVQRLAVIRFQMQTIQAAWDRLRQLCHASVVPEKESGTMEEFSLTGDIEFSRIRFSYTPEQTLFQDLDFTVREKELLFLTGANGAGKSTIFQLLMRLYEPQSGEIRIAGKSIRTYPLMQYRARIGYLGQTPDFFPGTIRENLLLNSSRTDEEIMSVLELLKSSELVLKRPDGLNSMISERAQNFSGGERLRLALARELLREKDILLLDEPAASLDYDTRREFYELLTRLRGKYTIIAITHDVLPPSGLYTFFHLEHTEK